ncbi:MAG: DNA-processing protein DprA [Candidatus Marinimicrobia bacterium]|nr:DNA-processing protein DprA [Candidatus Neomarinimicrobiota bacterium]
MSGVLGPRLYRRLCDSFGTAEAVLRQDRKTLAGIRGIGAEMADSIVRKSYRRKMDLQLEWMQKHGADYLTPEDGGYPEVLRHIYDAPPLLMYQGALDCVDDTAFAVVGTRHPDDYGKTMSGRIAGGIAEYGICIVSGMAKGVDSIAHREALKRGVPTVAVTGTPLDCIYPAENRMIHAQICEHGAVCSEQLIGDRVMPGNFIRRNRIISGLSRGVVVTQAGTRSRRPCHGAERE